jgi:hypothetical protein
MISDRRQAVWVSVGCLACVNLGVLVGSIYATKSLIIWAALVAIQGMMIVCLAAVIAYDSRHYIKELDELDRRRRLTDESHEMSPRMAMLERAFLVPENRLN